MDAGGINQFWEQLRTLVIPCALKDFKMANICSYGWPLKLVFNTADTKCRSPGHLYGKSMYKYVN